MDRMKARFGSDDVELLERSSAYDGFFRLDRVVLRHRLFAGGWTGLVRRELFVRDDAVAVLLYDPWQDAVVLIEQFRIGALEDETSPWLLELVAGIVEEGETYEDVAHRESREEAGARLLDVLPVCRYHVSPGGSQERLQLICAKVDARDLGGYHGLDHEHEDIRATVVPREAAYTAVESGRINNAPTIIGLQWLQLHWADLQRRWVNE